MAHRNLCEADLLGQGGQLLLVVGVAVAVGQGDGYRGEARFVGPGQVGPCLFNVERSQQLATRTYPLVHLDDVAVEHLREHDVEGKQLRTSLVADAQGVGEPPGHHQQGWFALAFKERVGGDGRAHLDAVHQPRWERVIGIKGEYGSDAGNRSI